MQGIEVDVTENLIREVEAKDKEIKRLRQQNKELKKELKMLKNTLERYQEVLDMQMKDSKEIKRGKDIEIDN